jgi:hypothetical protein
MAERWGKGNLWHLLREDNKTLCGRLLEISEVSLDPSSDVRCKLCLRGDAPLLPEIEEIHRDRVVAENTAEANANAADLLQKELEHR